MNNEEKEGERKMTINGKYTSRERIIVRRIAALTQVIK